MADKKFKSKLREKFKAREEGRSLSYGDRNVQEHYMKKKTKASISIPRKKTFTSQLRRKIKESLKTRATEMLPKKETTLSGGLTDLTNIKHPAELIPTIRKGRFLAGAIKSIAKR